MLFLYVCVCCWCRALNCLPGSWWTFGTSHADSVQKPVGHLLSIRGRWGMEWDSPSTGDIITLLTVQMCWGQWPSLAYVPNKWASECLCHWQNTRSRPEEEWSVSIRCMCRYTTGNLSLTESVTQLLRDTDLTHRATVWDSVHSSSWCQLTHCRILNWHTPVNTKSTAA